MAAVTAPQPKAGKYGALPNGRHIHFRLPQTIVWSVLAGLAGAGFIAGLYFGILEVNWHIFWLKPDWDGLFHQAWWATYRHTAFRDIPEPAFATLGVYTLLAKPKYWDKKVANWRLAVTPFAVIILTLALGVLGTWLLYFAPWAHGHDFSKVILWHSLGNLVLGFIIGHFMRYLWQPVGATFQGRILERGADRSAAINRAPMWVQLPLAPPVIRERFTRLFDASKGVQGDLYEHSRTRAWFIFFAVLVFAVVTVIGLYGHYWVGAGHHPYLLYTTR
jgi:hypothetical protein